MRQKGLLIGKCIMLLLLGSFLGALLLTLSYLVPVNTTHRDAAYEAIDSEGWYPRATIQSASMNTYFHSRFPDVLDGHSDRIILYTAMDTNSGNPLVRAMLAHSDYIGAYSYYWHGYVTLLRPLMLLMDFADLRILNGFCQLLLLALLGYLIGKEKGIRYIIMLVSSYLLLLPHAVSVSLQFSWVFYIAYIGTLILLRKRDYFSVNAGYIIFFLVIGMCTSYFDLLTYPLYTWGMPMVWWLVMSKKQGEKAGWVKQVITSGFGWIAGYAGMWVMKWTLGTIVLGENIFEKAMNEVLIRSGNGYRLGGRMDAIYSNWRHYESKVFFLILACWLLWWIYQTVRGRVQLVEPGKRYAYLLVGVSGIVWYFVLADHTSIHHFFTYRIFGVTLLAFFALILESVSLENSGGQFSIRLCLKRGVYWMVVAAMAIPLALTAREEFLVINGTSSFDTVQLQRGDCLETNFRPSFSKINWLGLGLECAGTEGQYEVTLWDNDEPKYQVNIPVTAAGGGNYGGGSVDWRLDAGKIYRMTLEVKDTEEPVYAWVTQNGEMPLSEYGQLLINGEEADGQLLTGIHYWCRPASKARLVFLELSWIGVLGVVGYILFGSMLGGRKREKFEKQSAA